MKRGALVWLALATIASQAALILISPTAAWAQATYSLIDVNGKSLGGSVTTGSTVKVSGDLSRVRRVVFTFDSTPVEDKTAPFTTLINLAAGEEPGEKTHTLKARVEFPGGSSETQVQSFTIASAPVPAPALAPAPAPAAASAAASAAEVVQVSTAAQLSSALSAARPGQTISLANGVYAGKFVINVSGTAAAPITLKGPGAGAAVLDGGAINTGYTLRLNNADYWKLEGFSITRGNKAIMADRTNRTTISRLDLGNTGQEVIHLRNFSTDNTVQDNLIHDAGKQTADYGEGVYLGSAKSNWDSASGGKPDASDRNQVLRNKIWNTTAEAIDIKEATTGGQIIGNELNGSGITGANFADSLIDAKGNNYLIKGNKVTGSSPALRDGFQTHVAVTGWGRNNTFDANSFVLVPGYAINGSGWPSIPNVVRCSNTWTTSTNKAISNIPCTNP